MISGPIDELGEIAEQFRRASQEVVPRITRRLADESMALVQQGHATGTAPDGQPWQANGEWKPDAVRRLNERGIAAVEDPVLTLTGDMMSRWEPVATDTTFGLVNDAPQAHAHQHGSVVGRGVQLPARPMVPDGPGFGTWQEPYDEATAEVIAELLPETV